MTIIWYHLKEELLLSKILLLSWHNRLPWQREIQWKTPYILALAAHNSKTKSVTPIFYDWKMTSMSRLNFMQILKKFLGADSEPPESAPKNFSLLRAKNLNLSNW